MKRTITNLISALALLVFMTPSMVGWGQTRGTASFAPSNFSGQGTSGTGSAISATVDGVTFACDKGYGTTQIRCYNGGTITISSSNTITAISFSFSGSYTGGMETSYSNLSTTSWTQILSSQARITACSVTYSDGGSSQLDPSDLALTGAPIALEFDLYNNSAAQVINYTTSSTGNVTVSASDYVTTEVNQNNKTITVTPTAVTPSAQTITVSQAADDTYEAGQVTFTVEVEDSTPSTGITATLNIQNYATANNWTSGTKYTAATIDPVIFTANGGGNTGKYYNTNNVHDWRYYQNESASITISVPQGYTLVSVKPTYSIQNGGVLKNGNSTIASGSTVSVSGTSVTFTVGNSGSATNGQVRFTNIDVVYVSDGGTQTTSDLTITNQTTNLTFDLYNNATSQVINYTTSSTGAITITPATSDYFTYVHDAQNKTITVTPTAVTPSAQTVTINQEADDDYYAGSASFTVSVANSAPLANIAALTALTTAGTYDVALSDAVVTYVNGNYAYIQDASGAVAMYKASHGFTAGDVLTGTATVAYQLRNSNPQITDLSGVTPVSGVAPAPTEVTASAWDYTFSNVLSQYFKVTGATITQDNNKYYVSLNNESVQLYKVGTAISNLNLTKTYSITGFPTMYNSTKELQIFVDPEVEASSDPSVTVTPNTISAPFTGVDGTLAITYENIPDLISFDIQFCDANGDELTGNDPEWIDAEIQEENDVYSLYYVIDANDGDARTAYFKVYTFVGNNSDEVYAIVTVNQAKYVVDYATLPFSFDGGKDDIENENGLTQFGLGSDYNSSPKLKFDGTDDCVVLKINERPGTLTFDIKGNSFSGGTFKVQTSDDGQTYTDLETYTEFGSSGNSTFEESFDNLGAGVRYIKWIYTEKSSGNVALGNITLAKYVEPVLVASITVDPALVNVNADEHDGTLALTYENLTIDDMTDFSIQHYNAQGEEISQPVWIEVLVAEQDPAVGEGYVVSYYMLENDGAARTAYFKVFAAGDEDFVYSNLVTVTQAAPVVDYALLPFEFDGGRAAIAGTNGLTQEGLDTDYASSPKLKFNNTGDWLILKLNSAPAAITFDIQGNSFSDGTFTVQTSNDGTTYTNLGEYTELGTTQTVTLINTNDAVRFVKWVYKEKVNGNVGLGNIIVTKAMPFDGNTTLTPSTFDPEKNHSYIVGDGATLTLDGDFSNILNEPNYLIIEDGGQVIVNNSGVQATVMKSVAHNTSKDADNWYTISSPVNNPAFANVTNLIQEPAANYDLYRYNETSMIWENKKAHTTDFTSLENGRGYLYWNSTGAELSFAGELNAADVTYHLTYGAEKDNLKGFNLIGNPFPHNIYKGNGAAICDSRLTSGFYVLNNASGWSANPEAYTTAITPGQGILVQTTAAFDLTITNTNAEATTAKSESNDLISFTVANDKYEDVAYVQFKDAIGLNKIEHLNAEIPMLYIFDEGSEFAIANLDRNTKGFDLNFEAATDGEYTVSAKAMGDFEYFHLIDRLAGNDIDMLSEGKYTFTAKKDDIKFRFYVKLSEKSNNSNAENGNFAFISNGQIILNGVSNDATLQVIDMMGRVVSSQTVNGNCAHMAPTASGVYVLRLIDGTNVLTQKIVVK